MIQNMRTEKFTLPDGREEYVNQNAYFDETKPVKYLVEYSAGQYDTYVTGAVCVYDRLDDAVKFVCDHYAWKDDITKKAVKNLYNHGGDYNVDAEDDPDFSNIEKYPFDKLEEDWKEYCFTEMFPGKTWDDVSVLEEDAYFEKTDNEDAFVAYLVKEKHLSEDVARASIIYNTADEHSEFCTDYHITKINSLQ